jgi:hypothetical protein
MRVVLQIASWTALTATIVPPMLFLSGRLSLTDMKLLMMWSTLVWFAVTPLWMDRDKQTGST